MAKKSSVIVVDLATERSRRKLVAYARRIHAALLQNRSALSQLFNSGAIFTRQGSRFGRDLLLAQHNLLHLQHLVGRLEEMSGGPADEIDRGYHELDELLAKTAQLTSRAPAQSGGRRE
jgi:hypothetical protein